MSTRVAYRQGRPSARGTAQRLTGSSREGKARDVLDQPWRKLLPRSDRPQGRDGVVAQLEREGGRGGEGRQRIFRVTFVGLRSETGHCLSAAADQSSESSARGLARIRGEEEEAREMDGRRRRKRRIKQGEHAGPMGVSRRCCRYCRRYCCGRCSRCALAGAVLCNDALRQSLVCAE